MTFAGRTICGCLVLSAASFGCGGGSAIQAGASAGAAGGASAGAGGSFSGAAGRSSGAAGRSAGTAGASTSGVGGATADAAGVGDADAGDGSADTLDGGAHDSDGAASGGGEDGNTGDSIGTTVYPGQFSECIADGGLGASDAAFSPGATCSPLPSCGGDPTGQWLAGADIGTECIRGAVTGGCALAGPAPGDPCAGLVYMPGALSGTSRVASLALPLPENPSVTSSTLILYPSGDFGVDLRIAGSAGIHFGPACLTADGANPTCAELASQVVISTAGFPDFTCVTATDGGCDCSWTFEGGTGNWGRWRTNGDLLLLDGIAPDGSAEQFTYDYCVRDGDLDLTAAPSSPFLGSDSYGQAGHPYGLRTLALEPAPGNLVHWDGTGWNTGTSGNALSLRAVWGTGPKDVWAVGTRATPSTLSPASAATETGGTVAHWDGTAWSEAEINTPLDLSQPFAAITAFQSVWGSGARDVWAVGIAGNGDPISHWDGAAWSHFTISNNPRLNGVWGSGPNDVWAVGIDPEGMAVILHYDGAQWSPAPNVPMTTGPLNGVWGSGPRDVWAVGAVNIEVDPGTAGILHWDGSTWSVAMTGTSDVTFSAIWGSGAADVWVLDTFSNFVHWNGSAWSRVTSGTTQTLVSLWGSGPNDVWAVGDAILHWNGAAWSSFSEPASQGLSGIWGSGPNDVWGVR